MQNYSYIISSLTNLLKSIKNDKQTNLFIFNIELKKALKELK